MKKKIFAFTSIRSDYNLCRDLYKFLNNDPSIDFKLVVSGAHLSPTYGMTVNQIELDGIEILAKIQTLLDSDSKSGRIKSASFLLLGAIEIINAENPDVLIYSGDREDVIIGALIGTYLNIPTIHLYAGDHVQDGHVDNPVRHATSKLSTFNICSTEKQLLRLKHIGEPDFRNFNFGSIALDKFLSEKTLSREEVEGYGLKLPPFHDFGLLIFHPIDGDDPEILENILNSILQAGKKLVIIKPNSDPGSRKIIEQITKFKNNSNFFIFSNLESRIFLTLFKKSSFIIGNSSAGILEAASIPVPAINVGNRQIGREANSNVIWTDSKIRNIVAAIKKATSQEFLNSIKNITNIYEKNDSSKNLYSFIKNTNFKNFVLKREDPLDVK